MQVGTCSTTDFVNRQFHCPCDDRQSPAHASTRLNDGDCATLTLVLFG